jgi:hypothetical protein
VAGGQQVVTLFEGVAGACHVELIRFVKQLGCAMQEQSFASRIMEIDTVSSSACRNCS